MLAYFGDELEQPCGACDLCDTPPELFDGTEAAQKALSAIYRTEERYGAEHLIAVLRGEGTEKVIRAGHDQLKVFGLGSDRDKNWWRGVFRQIYALGLTHPLTFFGLVTTVGLGNGMIIPNAIAGTLSVRPHLAGTASGLGGAIMVGGVRSG